MVQSSGAAAGRSPSGSRPSAIDDEHGRRKRQKALEGSGPLGGSKAETVTPGSIDDDDAALAVFDTWEETEAVEAKPPPPQSEWKRWVPKGVVFKNRKEKRAAAMAAMLAAGKLEGKAAENVRARPVMYAAGKAWEDATLQEWPENDYRLFVGDLAPNTTNEALVKAFSKYPSFAMSRIVKDRKSARPKVYGFVSFLDPNDFTRAWKEMNGKYIGDRPCSLSRSRWRDRLMASDRTQSKLAKQHAKRKLMEDAIAAGGIANLMDIHRRNSGSEAGGGATQ
ncbi:RRM domain-containing protein [Thecamonas trahens ATCC 50062]|uniref:RRM domain-containing protein n=1 Tax=Thecamonas trahens ATCC 50062 TaxID=461836 RepID=A0A0L0DPH9_THETB|nr:RRM domain-containing protein [Thecamonas trahens ATCC 50062]KNC54165.1 RRM domain-containing protein [Thecamonas trahens ATCC 50062]|eukprot:XP_013753983.1 RRM domain-containing protein [Thecamonas trahens ATCC 50062]